MKNKVFIIFVIILIYSTLFNHSYGANKQDIINYVNSQSVCGDVGLFNTYKTTFTRLLKQKYLTQKDLDSIYSYLTKAVELLNKKNVCKLSDLSKLTEKEKSTIYSSLTSGAEIITNAPSTQMNEGIVDNNKDKLENSSNINTNEDIKNSNNKYKDKSTKVTINSKDNTMDIYENGILMDKVSLDIPKMTYTGPSVTYLVVYIVTFLIFVIVILLWYITRNQHTPRLRILKNILMSCMISSVAVFVIFFLFGDELLEIRNMINLMSFKATDNNKVSVELNEDKSIKRYPSYGYNYGKLEIADLDISNNIYFGDADYILNSGIGHTTSSDMPTEGGVVIYSGHNNQEMLNNLKNVKKGTELVVDTTYAKCTYVVKDFNILADTEFNKLTKVDDKETLILYTCYPFGSYIYSNQRFVVYSTLKEIVWK